MKDIKAICSQGGETSVEKVNEGGCCASGGCPTDRCPDPGTFKGKLFIGGFLLAAGGVALFAVLGVVWVVSGLVALVGG